MTHHAVLGIDVGGSGIKGALVDVQHGTLLTERFRLPTPSPSRPEAVCDVIEALVEHFQWQGPIGCTFPSVVKQGVIHTAANVDKSWIGVNAAALFSQRVGQHVTVLNDADAAGIAEATFGAARDQRGVVMLLTIGTGIGSALLVNGHLVPNTELGHMDVDGKEAEARASDRIRHDHDLSWKDWARKFNKVLLDYERLFWPDLFVIGGGVSENPQKFFPLLTIKTPIVPATLRNTAGIVGAALAAAQATSA